ncbi:uncharacterized protein TNCV_4648931 [Trichonephila clavipes]|uniref:Uncharacterized protein n=1 Tax=Trichonephila clavipes TaxID=2585209 RepID=A0A8X6SUK3_TRICX|nr:uncharacterized protein TNCV_4648931 [Trichonephila clavipes]
MSDCGREHHIACMRSKSSSFEPSKCGSRTRRRPTKSHTCSVGDISSEKAGQGRSCTCWDEQKSRAVFATCGHALSY